MLRRIVTATLILASFTAFTYAQSKPNFSGTWKLNTAKSDFGMLPGPESQTNLIVHEDPAVKVDVAAENAQGKQNYLLSYTTDGKEAVNKMGPREVKSVAAWEGNALVLNSKMTFNDQDVTIKAAWTLSEDGKTMTQNVHLAAAMGETDQKQVFEKQDGSAPAAPAVAKAMEKPMLETGPKPNFSGVWKLNAAKSDFSVLPGPDSRVDIIDHAEPGVKISRKENSPDGAREYVLSMTNDGKEMANTLGPIEAKVTGSWEGGSHVMVMKLKVQDQDVTIKRVSTLSADGKTLIATSHIASAMGELDQKEVYEKQ